MIILEGPDGAGKSTLARHIMSQYGLCEFERGTKDRSKLYTVTRSDTYRALGAAASGAEPVRVADRLYYSDLVYAPATGRPCEFSPIEQGFIERVINAINCPVIVCMPPIGVARANALKDDQMDGVNDNFGTIYAGYAALLEAERFPEHALVYDYTQDTDGQEGLEVQNYIDEYLMERRHRSWAA